VRIEQVKPTRAELLSKRKQIELAVSGRDLLKRKRDALLQEFVKVMGTVVLTGAELERLAVEAYRSLVLSQAVDGERVRSAAFAATGDIWLDIKGSYVMGVPVPVIEKKTVGRSILARGYGLLGTSSRIDEAALKFEQEVDMVIEQAILETQLRRLGAEILKTTRRVNVLQELIIPRLQSEARYISQTLEERAREDLFRLKRLKKKIEAYEASAASARSF